MVKVVLCPSVMEKNHANFTALHKNLYQPLFHFVSLRVGNKEEAEDVVQDVFLKAYNSWEVLPESATAKNFLYYIARQKLIDLWKSARFRYSSGKELDESDFDEVDTGPLAIDLFEKGERKEEVKKILDSLKPGERDILYLRFLEEKSYEEISEVLKISEESARQKVKRALEGARKVVKKN